MNVSPRLIDDMLVVPPERVRWLSKAELDGYGMGSEDPVYAESLILEGAKKYGVSPAEYRDREQRTVTECKTAMTWDEAMGVRDGKRSDCAQAILSGR
jgi:hypothetical protein